MLQGVGLDVNYYVAAPRYPDREEREQCRNQIGRRMDRLGDQPEAVREQTDYQLDRDQHRGGGTEASAVRCGADSLRSMIRGSRR